MNPRLGLVRRLDRTGLGYQSRALEHMLKPSAILDVEHGEDIPGFIEYEQFLRKVDVMITAETPYVYEAWNWARMAGVKTVCQPNWELFDGLVQPNMPHPDLYLMPSYWHLEDMQKLFPNTGYLPPPTIEDSFAGAREKNFARRGKRRLMFTNGKTAIYDRNGWGLLMDALSQTKADFELVVYSQSEITGIADARVKYHIFDIEDHAERYTDFDAMIMPRRYGGLCLPMNEALMSGIPVIMPDISPNNRVLPSKWLVPAYVSARFEGRSTIDVYSTEGLAQKIDWLCGLSDDAMLAQKHEAYDIALDNYSERVLLPQYEKIIMELTGR